MQENLVSVIIPCYNQGAYIDETVSSVLNQTYTNIEIIIVNDGSTDNSLHVIERIIKKHPEISLLNITNGGVARARNKGIEIANGKFIFPLDADDLIEQTFIEKLIFEFKKDEGLVLATGNAKLFGEENYLWTLPQFTQKKMLHGNIIYASSMFKKSDWKKINGFDETLKFREDWEFYIRLTNLNPSKVKRINHIGLYYRIKKSSKSLVVSRNERIKQNTYYHIYNNNKELYFKYYGDPIKLIKDNESLKWEIEKRDRKLRFLNRFWFNRLFLYLRKKKHEK